MKYRREYSLKIIGKNLRYYRKKRGFSVEYVKEYLRIGSKQAIYKWENGNGYPQTDTMFALMELYEIGLRELLNEKPRFYSQKNVGWYIKDLYCIGNIFIYSTIEHKKEENKLKRYELYMERISKEA